MARLNYPNIIQTSAKNTALAELGKGFSQLDLTLILSNLVDVVPARMLPLLAEKWSVTGYDGWLLAESDSAKRQLIKNAVQLHRYKGTPWSIREIIRQLGFGDVVILEGLFDKRHDNSIKRDGNFYHGDRSKWACYRVILNQAITNDQAEQIRQTLQVFAPARCVLASLDYRSVAIRHNNKATRNGIYNRGTA
ncbi:phage tail protein I [Lonepinella koalarum]|uniref:Phage tail P2-like protein n=1 Tax=Lonepinella koalarum TaxID=53417 RepID=A0A4R1KJK5_9PAST|nr:phage tail protein I [Lonepinella koalarum]MDH2927365.1 phage tail protein [Lonepinella koalarum]TCK64904.1 phage tail P2-like protein [Lonepinella koalarum]TFJ88838.1 phage tail protein I [Lonepinella koalarum]